MPVIDQSIIVARPAAEVLDFLVRAENLARRDSSILECVQLDRAPVTVGPRDLPGGITVNGDQSVPESRNVAVGSQRL